MKILVCHRMPLRTSGIIRFLCRNRSDGYFEKLEMLFKAYFEISMLIPNHFNDSVYWDNKTLFVFMFFLDLLVNPSWSYFTSFFAPSITRGYWFVVNKSPNNIFAEYRPLLTATYNCSKQKRLAVLYPLQICFQVSNRSFQNAIRVCN